MDVDQQGLYLLTLICSLISLLSCCFVLMTCGITSLWRRSSTRMIMYLTFSNIITGITLLLPTYRYDFLCSVQNHFLHFSLISQTILTTLFLHFSYHKTVLELPFSQKIESIYLGLTVFFSLLLSVPPFLPENVGNNCWKSGHSPLQDSVSSFSFIVSCLVCLVFSFAFYLAMMVNLSLFPKGYYNEEFNSKFEKMRMMGKFTLMYYGIGMVLFIYGTLELIDRHRRGMDFIGMFCQANCGTLTLILFLSSDKIRRGMKKYFGEKTQIADSELSFDD